MATPVLSVIEGCLLADLQLRWDNMDKSLLVKGRLLLRLLFVGALMGLAPASHVRAAERSAKPLAVRIAIVSKSTLDLPFWVARGARLFSR